MTSVTEIIDISVPLSGRTPVWPGSYGLRVTRLLDLEAGDPATVSRLDCDLHVGTHVDAPLHFVAAGAPLVDVPLRVLVGPATVVDLRGVRVIDAASLDALSLDDSVERLLFRTDNSELWARHGSEFQPDYAALTADAARWVVERGIRLVGIDYLSIQRYTDDPETHRVLLGAGLAVVEGLDLSRVTPGDYFLVCLPLRLVGTEAAPARAVLFPAPPPAGRTVSVSEPR